MLDVPPSPTGKSWGNGVWLALAYLAIILLAAASVIPNLIGSQGNGARPVDSAIFGFEIAVKLYAVDHNGEFPTGSSDEVTKLLMSPGMDANGKRIPMYLEKPPKDAFGQLLNYEWPNKRLADATKPAIWSNGVNKQNEDGAGDDINNWSEAGQ